MMLSERIRKSLILIETGTPVEAARAFDELQAVANETDKLTKALVAFDVMLFPDDGDRDPADTWRMRWQLVKHMAQFMDDKGWAVDSRDMIERLTASLKEGK